MSLNFDYICIKGGWGGGGGGRVGFRPIILENSILRHGLKRFWVCMHNVAHVKPRRKNGPKTKIYTLGGRSL